MRLWRQLAVAGLAVLIAGGCARQRAARETLYQTSTINALMEGVYDGRLSVGELKRRGDFGIGTFNRLDGEMIVLEGRAYQARADGRLVEVADEARTPFATVTFFEPDREALVAEAVDFDGLARALDGLIATANLPYAIRIDGEFEQVRVRSVPAQRKPYPRLIEVARRQPEFELRQVRGTIVGFRCPEFVKGINVPGYHLHFIDADRRAGGHLLEVRGRDLRVRFDETPRATIDLSHGEGFAGASLGGDKQDELREIE